ncbi:MAG: class 3 adenylate cyclase, partial [Gammaproteobacteria bacterium]
MVLSPPSAGREKPALSCTRAARADVVSAYQLLTVTSRSDTMGPESTLAVILHADIVGSTALVQSDERVAHQRFQPAFERLSAVVHGHGGQTSELRGDALVAEFRRALTGGPGSGRRGGSV